MKNAQNGTSQPNGGSDKRCSTTPAKPAQVAPRPSIDNNLTNTNKAFGGGTVDTSPKPRKKGIISTNQTIPNN